MSGQCLLWGHLLGVTQGVPCRESPSECRAGAGGSEPAAATPGHPPCQRQVSPGGTAAEAGWPGDEVLVWCGAGLEQAQVSGRAVVGTLAPLLPVQDTWVGRCPVGQGSDPGVAMLLVPTFCNGYANGSVHRHTYACRACRLFAFAIEVCIEGHCSCGPWGVWFVPCACTDPQKLLSASPRRGWKGVGWWSCTEKCELCMCPGVALI